MVELEQKLDGLSALEAKPREELARRIRQRCGDREVSSRFGTRTYPPQGGARHGQAPDAKRH